MYTTQQIITFIENQTYCENIQPQDDLYRKHGIYGDDWDDLLIAYTKEFNVDMQNYIWHYHNRPEGGTGIWDMLFPYPPKEKYIPITATLLTDFANKGYWDITYPAGAHEQETNRTEPNNTLNYILLAILTILLVFISYLIHKYKSTL